MTSKNPLLLVMAAGMGSRYGGLKQLDPLGPAGEILLDYSVYDAMRAGFSRVIFVIRRDFQARFDELVRKKLKGRMDYSYAYQELDDLPAGYQIPPGRVKPWGTGHAVLAARHLIQGPLAVINADDYYGPQAYGAIYDFLSQADRGGLPQLGLCTWRLGDTLSPHGQVSRGVCQVQGDRLVGIQEIKAIEPKAGGIVHHLDQGQGYGQLDADLPVSMNFWGFPASFLDILSRDFHQFLENEAKLDPLTAEYPLPVQVGRAMAAKAVEVTAMPVPDAWYGVTNQEDRPRVTAALAAMSESGLYPSPLWT